MNQTTIVGQIKISDSLYPYSYNKTEEKITVYLGNHFVSLPEDTDTFVGQKYETQTEDKTLYKLCFPFSNEYMSIEEGSIVYYSLGNKISPVDYIIENYKENSRYSEIRFQFPELNYFIPSINRATIENQQIVISRLAEELLCFDFEYQNIIVNITFLSKMNCRKNVKATIETISEVKVKFAETDDIEFIRSLYEIIRCFFAFICNRKNIGLRKAVLVGKYPYKKNQEGKIVEVYSSTTQEIIFSQKFLEPEENDSIVAKTPHYSLFSEKISELFKLFSTEVNEYGPIVNSNSIHHSIKYRNLIDLEQSLHITATFEFYLKTLLPEISSQSTLDFFHDLEDLLEKYIEENKGKKREKAKEFKKRLNPNVALKDKIIKVYNGYSTWEPLKPILIEFFGENISGIAETANLWRNELAHEKREYQPSEDVIRAVRLIEHINYCIVLRKAGYNDEQIKNIVSEILTR